MKQSSQYTFGYKNDNPLLGRAALITGVARSGTTILGKLISSLKSVEFEYEPWLLAQLPLLEKEGLIESGVASELLQGNIYELFNSRLLGRGVNVRTTDDSAIAIDDLRYKWEKLKTRDDAKKYAAENNSLLVMKMVNLQPFYPFLFRSLPNVKIIHIVRNGLDAALSIQKKHWFSDAALNNTESVSIKKRAAGKERFLPWWVNQEDEERFIKYSEFSRGLCAWRTLMEHHGKTFLRLTAAEKKNYFEVRYETLIQNPAETLKGICRFLAADFGARTETILKTVDREKPVGCQEYPFNDADENELEKTLQLMKVNGYESQARTLSR